MSAFLPGGEVDYTHLPDVIRLFVERSSHPENVAAFQAYQAAAQLEYEATRPSETPGAFVSPEGLALWEKPKGVT